MLAFRLLVLPCFLFLSACATSPHTLYPDFKEQKNNLGNLLVVLDIAYLHDIDGDKDAFVIGENKELAQTIIKKLKEHLEHNGFTVEDTIVAGAGIGLSSNQKEIDFLLQEEYSDDETGKLAKAPFYLDKVLSGTETHAMTTDVELLSAIYHSAGAQNDEAGTASVMLEIPPFISELSEAEHVVFVHVLARDVGFMKAMGQGMITGLLFGFSVMDVPYVNGTYAVLNTKTGEVIWSDRKFVKGGGAVSPKRIENFAVNLTDRMAPNRKKNINRK